jgi:hypothetical protein
MGQLNEGSFYPAGVVPAILAFATNPYGSGYYNAANTISMLVDPLASCKEQERGTRSPLYYLSIVNYSGRNRSNIGGLNLHY